MLKKVIWITGGSSGIGFATAKYFLKNNWSVIISSSNIEKLTNAKNKIINDDNIENLHPIKCDITNKKEIEDTISYIENEIGNINIALLNAAAYSPNKNQEFDISNYELLIDVNLKGTLYCIDALKEVMKNKECLLNLHLLKAHRYNTIGCIQERDPYPLDFLLHLRYIFQTII